MKKRGVQSKKKQLPRKASLYIFLILITLNIVLAGLNIARTQGVFIPRQPQPIVVDGVIDLDDLSIEQKIAQMMVVLGIRYNENVFKKMQLGGIHLHAMKGEDEMREVVRSFQEGLEVPFFVTVDLEGCVSPFAYFKEFQSVNNVTSLGEAFEKGKLEGKYLSDLGVSVNFAPVVDLHDEIWNCRSFQGEKEDVSELANAYILGIQDEGILATAKHYPGKTLVIRDPHKFLAAAEITTDDLFPYQDLIDKDSVQAIMVSHLITFGEVNSEGKPSDASQKIITNLRDNFDGLIITDEINMLGLKNFYDSLDEMYIDVFKAGSDIVLNFQNDPNEVYRTITIIRDAVDDGIISEDRIDASVRKILTTKGFIVKD
ncbi:hypothetical protein HOL21_00475 [Candidatus Woesearchaeota archaeon]|jgi:beta-N-acetylhexosaminidase|nr:hypothetical protein [Candidatus Woesearchaeota archaeon]MBT5396672.1 hypothetical protein [Candidatus Woesearchaeota archaeon]MBT5924383.1 hypothetical protein [Candidatus Woesearchaeota archaeon]MBT6367541.1 hypothetical protein [Candidatus Woesearchaeota archaeon]MBT7763040.1 hypothetical protein [Candidatus Woesearchaeota archaeon]